MKEIESTPEPTTMLRTLVGDVARRDCDGVEAR
jgi:hypothetical protein